MPSKRICFIGKGHLLDQTRSVNGTKVQCYLLSREFANRGYDVHYLAATQNPEKILRKRERLENVVIHWIAAKKKGYFEKEQFKQIADILLEILPDIVYQRGRSYHTYIAGQYSRRNQKRFIWASNGENGCEPRKYVPNLARSNKSLAAKLFLLPQAIRVDRAFQKGIRMASIHVNQTNHQANDLKKYFSKNGVIIKSAHPFKDNVERCKKNQQVLWLGGLNEEKQPEKFIMLSESFLRENDWKFILAGGAQNKAFESKIYNLAKGKNNLELVGHVPYEDSSQYFANAWLSVNTSKVEGLPNAMVQSWLAGTPVVSLNVDPDDLITKYRMGLFAKSDMNCLIECCRKLMEDDQLRYEMSRNARKYSRQLFDIKTIGDQYESLMT